MAAALLAALTASCSGDDAETARVSGTVRLRGGAPVPGIAVVLLGQSPVNAAARIPLAPRAPRSTIFENPPRAITDAAGKYSLLAPSGRYDVWLGGSPDSGHMGVNAAEIVLGTKPVPLDLSYPGYRVSGRMLHQGIALASGDVFVLGGGNTRAELRENGAGQFAARTYSLLLPAGTYDFWANPNQGYPGVPRVKFEGITISADTTIDWVVDGHFVRGTVRSWDGTILYGAVVGASSPNASAFDYTTSIGTYGVHLPTGTYDFLVTPPPGADTLQALTVTGIQVTAPATQDFTLPQAP